MATGGIHRYPHPDDFTARDARAPTTSVTLMLHLGVTRPS
jgi:hypothetical protein